MFGLGKKKQAKADPLDQFEVPSFSAAILNLLNKLRDPETSINELAAELEVDPGLHVRVLKVVNSAGFGLSHKVSNIRHAVNLLGRSRLESLVLSVAVKDSLASASPLPWFDMQQFWTTAARRATVARQIANCLEPNQQADVFTISLLQDIGIPLLARQQPAIYREVYLRWLEDENIELTQLERQRCSSDHASVGGRMARSWGFPDPLIQAISSHHSALPPNIPLAVGIAALIRGNPELDTSSKLTDKAVQRFACDPELLFELLDTALAAGNDLSNALQ